MTCSNLLNNPQNNPLTRQKISIKAKLRGTAHINTKESHEKQRRTIMGKGHWNWQGGKTPESIRLRNQLEMKLWRKALFQRDNYTCQMCGIRNKKGLGRQVRLEADHIKPFSLFPDLRLTLDNGRTLCKECHKTTPTYMGRIKKYKLGLKT